MLAEFKDKNKELESNLFKLKTLLEDKESEFLELKRLLIEKNSTLDSLRLNKDIPFLTDRKVLENNNIHYSTKENMEETTTKQESFLEKVLQLFFGRGK